MILHLIPRVEFFGGSNEQHNTTSTAMTAYRDLHNTSYHSQDMVNVKSQDPIVASDIDERKTRAHKAPAPAIWVTVRVPGPPQTRMSKLFQCQTAKHINATNTSQVCISLQRPIPTTFNRPSAQHADDRVPSSMPGAASKSHTSPCHSPLHSVTCEQCAVRSGVPP